MYVLIYRISGFECVANRLRMALYKQPDCVSNYCVASGAYILICHYTYSLRFFGYLPIATKTRNNAIERASHLKPRYTVLCVVIVEREGVSVWLPLLECTLIF